MVYIEPYVQPRILRAIESNGGEANTWEICKLSGLKVKNILSCAGQLKNWGLLKKRKVYVMKNNMPCNICIYTLNEKRINDIHRVINKIPEGWVKT